MNSLLRIRKDRLSDGTVFDIAIGLPIRPRKGGPRPATHGLLRQKLTRLRIGEGVQIDEVERMAVGQISAQSKPLAEFRTQTVGGILYATRVA